MYDDHALDDEIFMNKTPGREGKTRERRGVWEIER